MNKEILRYGFSASGSFPSGSILFVNDPRFLTGGCLKKAFVEPDPAWQFSKISKGEKGSLLSRGKNKDSTVSEWAIALSYLILPKKPEYLRERILSRSGWAKIVRTVHGQENPDYSEWDLRNDFKKLIGTRLVEIIETGGSKGLSEITHLIEVIERKSEILPQNLLSAGTPLTGEEQDFCAVLERETCELEDVPSQRQIRESWVKMQAGRSEDQFRRIRDRLGFSWLPAAKRGKNRI
jgi:hypothetical protein